MMRKYTLQGITLIELLVVILIVVTLGAVVVPNLAPSIEQRRTREAARGISTFVAGARARAIRNGQPVGVLLQRLGSNLNASVALFYAEVPPASAGDLLTTALQLQLASSTPDMNGEYTVNARAQWGGFVGSRVGDLVQLERKGFYYRIVAFPTARSLTLQVHPNGGELPWPLTPTWSNPVAFQIFRQPVFYHTDPMTGTVGSGVAASSSEVLQLPPGTAIDLFCSRLPGASVQDIDMGNWGIQDDRPVVIVFSPSGGISSIIVSQGASFTPVGSVNLLVGKADKTPMPAPSAIDTWDDKNSNLFDMQNLWITINHTNGQVTTAENASVNRSAGQPFALAMGNDAKFVQAMLEATRFTRDTRTLGGE